MNEVRASLRRPVPPSRVPAAGMSLWEAAKRAWSLRGVMGRVKLAADTVVVGRILAPGWGLVRIGAGVRLDATQAPILLKAHAGAEIILEDGVVIESGASIEAVRSVRIGARSQLGAFCMILDNSLHQLEGDRLVRPQSHPVVLEEDVLIGPRSILLPGAHLGRGTRVGPCTVLSRRTPPGSVVVGHPAVIRKPA